MTEIGAGVGMFTFVVLVLVAVILIARSKLVASGSIDILVKVNIESKVCITIPVRRRHILEPKFIKDFILRPALNAFASPHYWQ